MLTEKSKISFDNLDSKYFIPLIINRSYKPVLNHLQHYANSINDTYITIIDNCC